MAIITWPTSLRPGPGVSFGQRRYDLTFASDATGATQDRVMAPPRWQLGIQQPGVLTDAEAGQWQAVLMQLRGRVNHLAAWNFARPQPLGTMRGTLTLSAALALGATSISVTGGVGQASTTLKAGDLLQIGTGLGTSQLVMVMADATANASGVISLTIEPPLRYDFASAAAVTWDRPLAYFKLQNVDSQWTYEPGPRPFTTGISLDLLESWT